MKFILILSLFLTLYVNSQPAMSQINYEKPEIRKNTNPLGENFNPRRNMVDAPSSLKREYVQNYKDRIRLRSGIVREFDVDSVKQWVHHLGKLNLNMITSQQFIEDVASMKGYAKSLEAYINERYKSVLNHLALIDLKLKEVAVLDQEIDHVKEAEPYHLNHPHWRQRLDEIIAHSGHFHTNFNVGIFGIHKVIERLTNYLDNLEQTYVDPKTLDYTNVPEEEVVEYIPNVSTYLNSASEWIKLYVPNIISNNILSNQVQNDVTHLEAHEIAKAVEKVAVQNLNHKNNVHSIEQIVNNKKNSLGQTNAQISDVVTNTVVQAVEKVLNLQPGDAKVDVELVVEEVKEKVNQKLDDVTQKNTPNEAETTAQENHQNNKKNNNSRVNEHHEDSSATANAHKNNSNKNNHAHANERHEEASGEPTANAHKNNSNKNNHAHVNEHHEEAAVEPTANAHKNNNHKNNKKNNITPVNEHHEEAVQVPEVEPTANAHKNNNHKNNKKNNSHVNEHHEEAVQAPVVEPAANAHKNNNHKNNKKNNSHVNEHHEEAVQVPAVESAAEKKEVTANAAVVEPTAKLAENKQEAAAEPSVAPAVEEPKKNNNKKNNNKKNNHKNTKNENAKPKKLKYY